MADNTWKVYEDTNGKFGIVGVTGYEQGYAELSEEDARVMAASRELFKALEHYLIQDEIAEGYGGGVGGSAREQARAAIAKATGVEQ